MQIALLGGPQTSRQKWGGELIKLELSRYWLIYLAVLTGGMLWKCKSVDPLENIKYGAQTQSEKGCMGKGLRGERVGVPWMNPTVWNKNTTACSPQGLGIGKGELPQHAFTLGVPSDLHICSHAEHRERRGFELKQGFKCRSSHTCLWCFCDCQPITE